MRKANVTKREAVKALLAISAAGALSACGNARSDSEAKYLPAIEDRINGEFTAQEFAFLQAVAQRIIPQTDTPGAIEAGVPDVVASLVSDWGDDVYQRYWLNGLKALTSALNAKTSGGFIAATAAQQNEILAGYDADVYSGRKKDGFYKDMKTTFVTAYYMSETGATEELIYEPVPGDWIGEVPFSEIGKTWAT